MKEQERHVASVIGTGFSIAALAFLTGCTSAYQVQLKREEALLKSLTAASDSLELQRLASHDVSQVVRGHAISLISDVEFLESVFEQRYLNIADRRASIGRLAQLGEVDAVVRNIGRAPGSKEQFELICTALDSGDREFLTALVARGMGTMNQHRTDMLRQILNVQELVESDDMRSHQFEVKVTCKADERSYYVPGTPGPAYIFTAETLTLSVAQKAPGAAIVATDQWRVYPPSKIQCPVDCPQTLKIDTTALMDRLRASFPATRELLRGKQQ